MSTCISCKNKTSNDRCNNNALAGISYCGVHARNKQPRIWSVINGLDKHATIISKFWRGHNVRKLIQLSGPGTLNRSVCTNQEEISSFEDLKTVDINNYFGFKENDKVYGFDIRTIFDILNRSKNPQNPYTRQPLSIETRRRARDIYRYRFRRRLPIYYENNMTMTIEGIINQRWLQICQIIEENGFYDVDPNIFLGLNKSQLYVFLNLIWNDLKTWAAEHNGKDKSIRPKYVFWTRSIINKYSRAESTSEYSFYVSTVLMTILFDFVDPYAICFIIMSALTRL